MVTCGSSLPGHSSVANVLTLKWCLNGKEHSSAFGFTSQKSVTTGQCCFQTTFGEDPCNKQSHAGTTTF